MDDDALIEVASAAAARGIESLDMQTWAEVMLYPYESLSPLVFGIPADAGPQYEFDDGRAELGFLPDPDDAAFREVRARVDQGGDDGYALFVSFYSALASRLHAMTGIPVFIDGWDTDEQQLS